MDKLTLDLLERMRKFAMSKGPVRCGKTWLHQVGEIRFATTDPWKHFEADETFDSSGVNFLWNARVRMGPIVHAKVDRFEAGVSNAADLINFSRLCQSASPPVV